MAKEESIETEIDLSNDALPPPSSKTKQGAERESEFDIHVVDDTPEEDRNRPKRPESARSAIPDDDEVAQYGKGVQERIRQMKREYHDERRAKEQWQREHEAALTMARTVYTENQRLKKLLEDGHKTMLGSNKSAAESELTALKGSLRAAHEAGDAEKIADVQEKLSKAAARLVSIEQTEPVKFEDPTDPGARRQEQQRPQVTGQMQEWMDDNPWFNGKTATERKMTSYAFGVHDSLIASGVVAESPAYFKAVNEEMKSKFPEYYGKDDTGSRSAPQRRSIVAGAGRINGGGSNEGSNRRTRVELTRSQEQLIKRLGIPAEQYVREVLKLENSNG